MAAVVVPRPGASQYPVTPRSTRGRSLKRRNATDGGAFSTACDHARLAVTGKGLRLRPRVERGVTGEG
jgi:hypothetical protein